MIEIDESMYEPIESTNLGVFSRGWVRFNKGLFQGKTTLIKNVGKYKGSRTVDFVNVGNYEIPFIALNPLIAESLSKLGDPKGEVAEYYLVKQNGELLICSPSFIDDTEELIEGTDILKHEHQRLSRLNPEDVIIMVSDIIEQQRKRKVPQEVIDENIKQFLKDCFKNAYMEMIDSHNSNFGMLYAGIGRARTAPIYDLDVGLNVPFEYIPDIDPLIKNVISGNKAMMSSDDFLPNYIATIGKKYTWFDSWVKGFINNLRDIDLGRILLEEKQVEIGPEQIKHYMDFIKSKNAIIDKYFLRVSGQR